MNGGVCIDGVDSFKCSCPATTSGVLCQCVSTTDGQHCQPLPYWFEDKPFQPNVPLDPKFFGTRFNDSLIEHIPSPTLGEDTYVTSVSDTAEFPSAVVTSDILMSSFITPTMDVFTMSSVMSAKVSLVFSEVPVVTVPYLTSPLYESPFPSTSPDPFLTEPSKPMQPTPVLPVLTSSPTPEEFVTSYEYPAETKVLPSTLLTTLEGSLPTPSTEFILPSLVSVIDVSKPLYSCLIFYFEFKPLPVVIIQS